MSHAVVHAYHVDRTFELFQVRIVAEIMQQHDGAVAGQLHAMPGDVNDGHVIGVRIAGVLEVNHLGLHIPYRGRKVTVQQRLDVRMDHFSIRWR